MTASVPAARDATGNITGVRMLAAEERVERTPTARPSTTELSARVLLTSWVTPTLAATQSAPVTMTVPATRPVSSSSAVTPATIPTPMCVAPGRPARPPTTRLSAPAPRATLVTHSSAAVHLRRRTCARPTLAVRELSVKLASTDPELTDQCAPVQLDTEETLSSDAAEESASMTASVRLTELALISIVGLRVRMLAVRTQSVRPGTMEQSAPVLQDTLEIH